MSVAGIGAGSQTYSAEYAERKDLVVKTYAYKDGKGQEITYNLKDCLQLSLDSYEIPVGSETYEALKNHMKPLGAAYMSLPSNKLFYETYDVMTDFYDGKLGRDEVKNIFKEYFYHSGGRAFATDRLAGLYEYFSRANTRCACLQNEKEGKELLESKGLSWRGSYYYNADWYWACEDMQELFRETANELADEYGVEHVDFEAVEKNTKFKLDGGITYNGVWSSKVWQSNYTGNRVGNLLDTNVVPPKGFVYCNCAAPEEKQTGRSGAPTPESMEEAVKKLNGNKKYAKYLFCMVMGSYEPTSGSKFLDKKNKIFSGSEEEKSLYQNALDFLKNFNISYRRSNRLEFIKMGE